MGSGATAAFGAAAGATGAGAGTTGVGLGTAGAGAATGVGALGMGIDGVTGAEALALTSAPGEMATPGLRGLLTGCAGGVGLGRLASFIK